MAHQNEATAAPQRAATVQGVGALRHGYAVWLVQDGVRYRVTPVYDAVDIAHLAGMPIADAHPDATYVVRECCEYLQ